MPQKKKSTPEEPIYQLKISLKDSKPPIWRRVLVAGNTPLNQFHQILQIVMGWRGGHLHQFVIAGQTFAVPHEEDWEPVADERKVTLSQCIPGEKFKFRYEYDFGDDWQHVILVEKILPLNPDEQYPMCIKGKRACPPEDCGGIWGYSDFLDAIGNPEHPEHQSMLEWAGGSFESEVFDMEAVNQQLRNF